MAPSRQRAAIAMLLVLNELLVKHAAGRQQTPDQVNRPQKPNGEGGPMERSS